MQIKIFSTKIAYAYNLGFIALFTITLDQASKYLIRRYGGFYLCNKGVGWGISISSFWFWTMWIVIILTLAWFIRKKHLSYSSAGLILILSGALSNALDRLIFDCVIDFIDIKIWPVFNLADASIVIGGIMVITSLKSKV